MEAVMFASYLMTQLDTKSDIKIAVRKVAMVFLLLRFLIIRICKSALAAGRNPLLSMMCVAMLGICTAGAGAATLNISATDKGGAQMADVVVYAMPIGVSVDPLPANSEMETISQNHLQFSPYVTPVRVGSSIRFPNYDRIEHHVKSFSPTKEFEIKVYESGTPPPVVFDKAGIVVVYCLLHEWMRAYVMVLDTPYFSKTDASGTASLSGLKAGTYEIKAWHPDMGTIKPALSQTIKVTEKEVIPLQFSFDFLPRKRKTGK
jgi:plastocyanin